MTTINNTLFVGKFLIHLQSIDSTNSYAAQLLSAKSKPIDGTVIYTMNQTHGRGQIGSSWESQPDKNIALSLIIYPTFLQANKQFDLNIAVSLAVHDTLNQILSQIPKNNLCSVKWPNDIYINEKKTAGVLIQNTLAGANIQSSIIGIGLNINQLFFENLPKATSLAIATDQQYDLENTLQLLCQSLEHRYIQLKSCNAKKLKEEYLAKLYRYKTEALFQNQDGTRFFGKITGVDTIGKLIIQTDKGSETFALKEVQFL